MSTYEGLLVRDAYNDAGQIPSPTVAPTASPDVICYQMNTLAPQDAEITYDKPICKSFQQDVPNNIYIRAKNISGKTMPGKVKAFYAPLNLLYMPQKWIALTNISGEKTELELVDSNYASCKGNYAGVPDQKVAINKEAFVLNAVADPHAHHCMMGLCTSPDGTFLTLPAEIRNGNNGLWWFLRSHPEIAYRNIIIEQPLTHTTTLAVNIGNHDDAMRRFVMNVAVNKGVETLKGAMLLMQSTDSECRFTHKLELDGKTTQYAVEAKVPAGFDGFMNFSVIMRDYANVDALLHVQNLAVDLPNDQMIPDAVLRFPSGSGEATGTLLGDFQLYLGSRYDTAPQAACPRATGVRKLSLPELTVYREM